MQALSQGCSAKAANNPLSIHVNTAPQIADMVAIIEQHGRWREQEAQKYLSSGNLDNLSGKEISQILERTKWTRGEEKLNFWGFSYGTVIGAHFAAMQPHRIGRVVLDGVVDTPDYMLGTRLHSLYDTDTIIDRQAEHCDLAGPDHCPLYMAGGPRVIAQNVRSVLKSLKDDPLGVPGSGEGREALAPDLITHSNLIGSAFNALYAPIQSFSPLASILSDISNRNGTSFAIQKQKFQPQFFLPNNNALLSLEEQNDCLIQRLVPGDTRTAIICTDVNATAGISRADFTDYISTLRTQSPLFADLFAQVRMKCIDWRLRPKWRFDGPFASSAIAFPLLLVGTRADPVTPIRKSVTFFSVLFFLCKCLCCSLIRKLMLYVVPTRLLLAFLLQ